MCIHPSIKHGKISLLILLVALLCGGSVKAQLLRAPSFVYGSISQNATYNPGIASSNKMLRQAIGDYLAANITKEFKLEEFLARSPVVDEKWSPRWVFESLSDNINDHDVIYSLLQVVLTKSGNSRAESNYEQKDKTLKSIVILTEAMHEAGYERDLVLAVADAYLMNEIDNFKDVFPEYFSSQRVLERLLTIYLEDSATGQQARALKKLGQIAHNGNTRDWANLRCAQIYAAEGDITAAKQMIARSYGQDAFRFARRYYRKEWSKPKGQ